MSLDLEDTQILFIGLFNYVSSAAQVYIASKGRMFMNYKLGRTWWETVVACLQTVHQNLSRDTDKNHSRPSGLNSKPRPFYEGGVTLALQCSVSRIESALD
jgi:hypothetical protein